MERKKAARWLAEFLCNNLNAEDYKIDFERNFLALSAPGVCPNCASFQAEVERLRGQLNTAIAERDRARGERGQPDPAFEEAWIAMVGVLDEVALGWFVEKKGTLKEQALDTIRRLAAERDEARAALDQERQWSLSLTRTSL